MHTHQAMEEYESARQDLEAILYLDPAQFLKSTCYYVFIQ
jgi:hypothetical protein